MRETEQAAATSLNSTRRSTTDADLSVEMIGIADALRLMEILYPEMCVKLGS